MNKTKLVQAIGIVGAIACLIIYISEPSFPTPDKLFIFGAFVAMIFKKSVEMLKRFSPFIAIILVYESFRGIADYLNQNVNFTFMIDADKLLFFGQLPTAIFQSWLWHGNVQWYDFIFYLVYMMHFVFPLVLAVIIWQKFDAKYWLFITTYSVLLFTGFLTYLLFPAAPPWMASDLGYIEHIERISSHVWFALGIHDFPSLYNEIAPNPVAAVPSLHAAFGFLFAIFIQNLFKSKLRYLAWLYPTLIVFGTVYMGEHYLIDAILGLIYAVAAYKVSPSFLKFIQKKFNPKKLSNRLRLRNQ